MRRVYTLLLLTMLLTVFDTIAADTFKVSGKICDERKRPIIGATVILKELRSAGSVTTIEGDYLLEVPRGNYILIAQYMGYETVEKAITVNGNLSLPITMKEGSTALDEVVVSATSSIEKLNNVQIGVERVSIETLSKTPALFGENDIIKSITLLPGVRSEGDGSSGFEVRGGTSSQNLILLDDAPVYNSGHVLGIFSVFNDDALAGADLYKGQIPATYGGATSAVLDIQTKQGDKQGFSGGADIGLLSSKAYIELPVIEDKLSVFVAGRRSYFDLFLYLDDDFAGNKLYFYDINAKIDYKMDNKNRFSLSYFKGKDMMGLEDMMSMGWGNDALTFKWIHQFNDKLTATTTLVGSDYESANTIDALDIYCTFNGYIKTANLKENLIYTPNESHTLRLGAQTNWIDLLSAEWQFNDIIQNERRMGWENSIWANEEWHVNDWLDLSAGLRLNLYMAMGGSPYYELDEYGDISSTTNYASGDVVTSYWQLEPRFSASFSLSPLQRLKLGYSKSSQNVHALRNSSTSMPFDRYILSSNLIEPQTSDQVALGYMILSPSQNYEFSVEAYYKKIDNVYDYMDGKSFNSAIEIETLVLGGEGRSYGAEFSAKKNFGKLTGWVGYTLSWVENKIDGINNNKWYTASNDQRHDITLVAMYDLPKGWSTSANFVYNTGQALTAPSAKYEIEGVTQYYYAERNGYRAPDYHRLDISFSHTKQKSWYERQWTFGFYNVYNRYNPYMIYFENDDTSETGTRTIQYSLFGIIPSVSYGITF